MHIDELRDYCMSKKAVTEEFPFDESTLVFKVMGKMFCLTGLDRWERGEPAINLKCNPEKAIELRVEYDGTVIGGYHSNKKHWNTIFIDKAMEASELKKWIDHSYELVIGKLTRAQKEDLKNL
ncbi:MmcQ/YjbR family DNA-binding protein [Nonlabens ulvanivorans]|uniref:MmcQ/YjbR family DNA-binding protein n=1 Tax=Nonlabens ulvanivorans TaxID=906888 RepID=UPI0029425B48|nr:MmcQ/YjbR family DNA-binding protein [Nonlabens ulvanivorans]WOI21989.1 MmcQ/YjbR family DNA-binding protein [Nonlabens ulvanivorans]